MSEHDFRNEPEGRREPWRGEGELAAGRRPLRLPIDMPRPGSSRESRVLGRAVSIAIHALIVLALLLPALLSQRVRSAIMTGAGGAGPAGGGGGRGGVTGARETLRYVRVAPDPAPTPAPTVTPTPVAPPPKPQAVQPMPAPVQPQATPPPLAAAPSGAASGSGDATGGGGAGPGTGGGIGAGVGTGNGNANGPGTGGGADTVHAPFVVNMLQPPQGYPPSLKNTVIGLDFEIDSTGRILDVTITPPLADRDYKKKVLETAQRFKFRPATRLDGTPIRGTFHAEWTIF